MSRPCRNEVSGNQRKVILSGLFQRACVYFHIVGTEPFAARIADYPDRMHPRKAYDLLLYFYHFLFFHCMASSYSFYKRFFHLNTGTWETQSFNFHLTALYPARLQAAPSRFALPDMYSSARRLLQAAISEGSAGYSGSLLNK